MGFETIICKKILKLVEKTDYNPSMISKGCDVSLPTIYKILKGNPAGIRRKSLEKVLDFLIQVDQEQSKMYLQNGDNVYNATDLEKEYGKSNQILKSINQQSEEIKSINQKIDILFDIIRAGSQQLSMSLVQTRELKIETHIANEAIHKKIDSLLNEFKGFSIQNKKNL